MANTEKKTAGTLPAPKAKSAKPVKPALKKSAAKPTAAAQDVKTGKPKKPKMVRDSFTMPKGEYSALDELKLRAVKLMQPVKKSELLRAGIKSLTGMSDDAFLAALKAVPAIKTGRPKTS